MKVGDKISKVPESLYGNDNCDIRIARKRQYHTGTVIYIQPSKRFYTVEFDIGMGKIRESYTDLDEKMEDAKPDFKQFEGEVHEKGKQDDKETCLTCPLARCMMGTNACPLRAKGKG